MSNNVILADRRLNLPAEVCTEIQLLTTSPQKYLETLPIEQYSAKRPDNAIMLSHMKRSLDCDRQLMYLSMLIIEVNDFFNIKGNMNAKQIRKTAELILDNDGFFDLTLGNIKACFKEKMMTARLYDRLDGNIIIDWLREFKSNMADYCENVRLGEDRANEDDSEMHESISHAAYIAMLEAKANDGDKEAEQTLMEYKRREKILSDEEVRQKEMDFQRYRLEYLKQKGLCKN